MALIKSFLNARGVTLLEILVATLLMGLVLAGGISIFATGARFMGRINTNMQTLLPPSINAITKRIDLANLAAVPSVDRLNARCDCNADLSLQADGPGVNDTWFHFVLTGNNVRWWSDLIQNSDIPTSPPAPVLYSNVDSANSSFALMNPSAQGTASVVQTILVFTSPVVTLKTQTAIGGGAKR